MTAVEAAVAVARAHGLGMLGPRLLHQANNVVLHLEPLPLVAKVGNDFDRETFAREVAVAEHASTVGAPVTRPTDLLPPGPHDHLRHVVTFWRLIDDRGEAEPRAAAQALRRVHDALASFPGPLPSWTGLLDDARQMLASAPLPHLRAGDRAFLRDKLTELRTEVDALPLRLQPLHGDSHLGNVLQAPAGPVWIDLQTACIGPIEWDVASLVAEAVGEFDGVDAHTLHLVAGLKSACVSTWCWQLYDRGGRVSEAAHFHLERLRAEL